MKYRLFLPPEQISDDIAHILDADHQHLARVLRARAGEPLMLLDNAGNAFRAVLVSIGKTETIARIESRLELPEEPPVSVTVAQALGKGDKFEQVLQHGTEAGASVFVPVRAERCVVEIPAAKVADRVARWRQIAKGAAEQSGRGRIPEVWGPLDFVELCKRAQEEAVPGALLHPSEEAIPLRTFLQGL